MEHRKTKQYPLFFFYFLVFSHHSLPVRVFSIRDNLLRSGAGVSERNWEPCLSGKSEHKSFPFSPPLRYFCRQEFFCIKISGNRFTVADSHFCWSGHRNKKHWGDWLCTIGYFLTLSHRTFIGSLLYPRPWGKEEWVMETVVGSSTKEGAWREQWAPENREGPLRCQDQRQEQWEATSNQGGDLGTLPTATVCSRGVRPVPPQGTGF